MAVPTIDFSTGPATLLDCGVLEYNGCVFSPLFATQIFGKCVKDEAQRTVIYMEYTITVDGYVTAPADNKITVTMKNLYDLLTKQAAPLRYEGRGHDIVVNTNPNNRDVKWGPIPEVLEFQPLGGGLSAKIKWTCKVHIIEQGSSALTGPGKGGGGPGGPGGNEPFRPGSAAPGPGGGGAGFNSGLVKPGPSRVF